MATNPHTFRWMLKNIDPKLKRKTVYFNDAVLIYNNPPLILICSIINYFKVKKKMITQQIIKVLGVLQDLVMNIICIMSIVSVLTCMKVVDVST